MRGWVSYEQMMEKSGKTYRTLSHIVSILRMQGKIYGRKVYFHPLQVKEILDYRPPSNKKDNNRRKITIIEFYQKQRSCRKVATTLNIERKFVNAAVKEWMENDEHIVIESKMNHER